MSNIIVHYGYLPWNRGADPNLWSWLTNTPKGVSLYDISAGPQLVLLQKQVEFDLSDTLASSQVKLEESGVRLLSKYWLSPWKYLGRYSSNLAGSEHDELDKDRIWNLLPDGVHTPCWKVQEIGKRLGYH